MKKKQNDGYVLDTFAFLAYYYEEVGTDVIEKLLNQAQEKKISLYISEINLGEIYYIILRDKGEEVAGSTLTNLLKLPVEIISTNLTLVLTAARYKSRGRISYADCFVLAVAQEKKAQIVTGDPEFEPFEDEFPIIWLQG